MDKTVEILKYLEVKGKQMLDKKYALDCCIPATRIVLDVLEHFQIPAKAVVTKVFLCNSIYREWIEKEGRLPDPSESPKLFASGGYSILLGADKNPTRRPTGGVGFPGHVVAYVDEGYMVDLTLPQAHRPRHKIYLKPMIAKVGSHFPEEGEVFLYPQKEGGKLLLDYRVVQNDSYQETPDWLANRRKEISFPAIAALENFFKEHADEQGAINRADS